MMRKFNQYTLYTLSVASLALSLFFWQGNLEGTGLNMLWGVVIPSAAACFAVFRKSEGFLVWISLFLMVFAQMIYPLTPGLIGEKIVMVIILFTVCYMLKPPLVFLCGCLGAFWILFGWSYAELQPGIASLEDIKGYAELYGFWLAANWKVMIVYGFALTLMHGITNRIYEKGGLFHFAAGIYSLPLLSIPAVWIGAAYGIFGTYTRLIQTFQKNVYRQRHIPGDAEQPALERYIFGKALKDYKKLAGASTAELADFARSMSRRLRPHHSFYNKMYHFYECIILLAAIAVLFTAGWLIASLMLAVHFAILLAWAIPVYLFLFAVGQMDSLFRKKNHIQSVCRECHHTSSLPVYLCPSCSCEHSDLRPGKYGILKRTCRCGEKLPAVKSFGRTKLYSICGGCKKPLSSGETKPIRIPVIGTESAGKTTFIMTALQQLLKHQSWDVQFAQKADHDAYQNLENIRMSNGAYPGGDLSIPIAHQLILQDEKWNITRLISIYDSGGKAFTGSQPLRSHSYLKSFDGLILIIDPSSIPAFSESQHHSATRFEDVFDRLLIELQESGGIKAHEKITAPLAIVLTKFDRYHHEAAGPVKQLAASMSLNTGNEQEAIKRFLAEMGHTNFLRMLDSKFPSVRFFSTGPDNGGDSRASAPFLWLFSEADRKLKPMQEGTAS